MNAGPLLVKRSAYHSSKSSAPPHIQSIYKFFAYGVVFVGGAACMGYYGTTS